MYVPNTQHRREIRAATTKIESYNDFSQWITFGGDGILKSRDPVENEKIIKYKDLFANAIMVQNEEEAEVEVPIPAGWTPVLVVGDKVRLPAGTTGI